MNDELKAQLIELCRAGAPREVCGYIVYSNGTWWASPITNVHKEPERFYTMEPKEVVWLWSQEDLDIVGEYHSHPNGPARPSTTDLRYAVPGLRHWIVTPESVHEWETP